ncbi:MarR family winged helix-turn-helix transcriptional regulator [Flavihumibacter solisilvae]|uniref:MarR family transcriptional regulator n=1 Tax=Flavihumibacter solisilvae TaxID=1349421 RepID=A0A0C1ITG2_9BACT|nr:MarR family transcriptional regulator [Flavihumibacter solisilvae]KIC93734.1 MarR family transcriptional regulator [Flavihumibacter solisilvae]
MSFYQNTGVLVFGSRLRRLSESFLADVNRTYRHLGIRFDAAWFPIFYMLSRKVAVSIREISEELEVSHSAASQLISKLQEKGLIRSVTDKSDARKKKVTFTSKGQKLLEQVLPVWEALQKAMDEMFRDLPQGKLLMGAISETEQAFLDSSIFNRIEKHLK